MTEWVEVYHPKTKGKATVARSSLAHLARSGWQPVEAKKSDSKNESSKTK